MRYIVVALVFALAGCSDDPQANRDALKGLGQLSAANQSSAPTSFHQKTKMRCTRYSWGTSCKPY